MESSHQLSEQDYLLLDKRCRQTRYLEQLQCFHAEARRYFLAVFDGLSKTRGVNSEIRILVKSGSDYPEAYALASELVELIEQLVSSRSQKDFSTFHTLRAILDDINVAVNAWVNQQCLHHSSQNVAAYRTLREQALRPTLN